jgi:exopolysaccharide biosynthesis polyprenyl glycosylphosphotransferase
MASEPNFQIYPGALPAPSYGKKKPRGTGTARLPLAGSERQLGANIRGRSPLARSAGPLASPTLHSGRWVQAAYVVADLFCIALTFAVVLMARCAPSWRAYSIAGTWKSLGSGIPKEYAGVLLLYAALIVLFSQTYGLYRTPRDRSRPQETFLVAKVLFWSTAILIAAVYLSDARTISRVVILASAATNAVVLASWRIWKRGIVERRVAAGIGVRNVLIVGAGKLGRELAEYFDTNRYLGVVVKGFLDHNHVGESEALGSIENLAEVCRTHFIDEIIITIPFMRRRVRHVLLQARLNNLDVKIVPDLYGSVARGATLEHLGLIPVMSLRVRQFPMFGLLFKRAMDIVASAIGLAFLWPLLAAIAVAIRIETPGPVLYRAWRAGKKGRKFVCYKFRTMVQNADALKSLLLNLNERQGATFKITGDPRITRVGRFLRKYSLDELPQLWKVLKGEMSLVGPRPHPIDDCERYELEHLRRLDVTPGITGLWQVTARRDPSFAINMALDLEYIDGWNVWTDFTLLFKTVFVVLAGHGQ